MTTLLVIKLNQFSDEPEGRRCAYVCVYICVMCMHLRSLIARMRACMFVWICIFIVTCKRVRVCVTGGLVIDCRQTPKHCVHSEESVTQTLVGAFSSPGLLRYRTVRDLVDRSVVSCRAAASVRSCRMCAPIATIIFHVHTAKI